MALRTLPAILAVAALTAVAAPTAGSAPAGQLSIAVGPPTLTLSGGESTTLKVRNNGAAPQWISVTTGNFDITPAGVVRIDPKKTPGRSAKAWLKVTPIRLRLAAGATGEVIVASAPSRVAAPGDHQALVLFTSDDPRSGAVSIKARVGVTVLVRVGGPLRRALKMQKPVVARRSKRRYLTLRLTNNGNVAERLAAKSVALTVRSGRRKLVLRGVRSTILPGTTRQLWLRLPKSWKGASRVTVTITPRNAADLPRAKRAKRTFRVALGK